MSHKEPKITFDELLLGILFSKSRYYVIYPFQQHSPERKMFLN